MKRSWFSFFLQSIESLYIKISSSLCFMRDYWILYLFYWRVDVWIDPSWYNFLSIYDVNLVEFYVVVFKSFFLSYFWSCLRFKWTDEFEKSAKELKISDLSSSLNLEPSCDSWILVKHLLCTAYLYLSLILLISLLSEILGLLEPICIELLKFVFLLTKWDFNDCLNLSTCFGVC